MDEQRMPTVLGMDDPARRAGVVAAIEAGGGEVVAEAAMGRLLVALAGVLRPPLVVVDPDIAGRLGNTFVPRLVDAAPEARIAVLGPLVAPAAVDLSNVRVIDTDEQEALTRFVEGVAEPVLELRLIAETANA